MSPGHDCPDCRALVQRKVEAAANADVVIALGKPVPRDVPQAVHAS